jgi:hypothetical protein
MVGWWHIDDPLPAAAAGRSRGIRSGIPDRGHRTEQRGYNPGDSQASPQADDLGAVLAGGRPRPGRAGGRPRQPPKRPNPVIWEPGQDYRIADAIHAARAQPSRARHGPERVGPERWQLAGEFVADVHQLEQRIAAIEARIKTAVAQSNSSLLELFGVGPGLAATFLGEVGECGWPPVPAR